ncbi:hypothetical protein MJG53_020735 [Ovis ammon polii x Ovis aries]|uniref:Uncharacterized protein n=1 Tax=Ovis ammon polii x Ovis aries TaxID=2918886 RepID=A0ACB9V1H1_9CETA|nr:hypothetical protein MJG53_020735 [Ovis ammon polii x Ovis aries]
MGPVMPPSKKPESSGISVSSGLSQRYRGSGFSKALQEDDDLDFPLPDTRLEEGAMEDEELTNLNWLHESKNLLKSFGDSVLRSVSPVQDPDDDPPPSPAHSDVPYDARQNPNCKPPYSFSCLIFMAIEDSPTKRLPVKDIYNWILEHFPYFANAPTGWKNSVRHNLSLNKCFKKVDKERSQVSLGGWSSGFSFGSETCLREEKMSRNVNLLYGSGPSVDSSGSRCFLFCFSTSGPPLWPGSTFFKRNGALLQGRPLHAPAPASPPSLRRGAPTAGLASPRLLGELGRLPGAAPGGLTCPLSSPPCRNGLPGCRLRTESEPACGSPVVSGDPKEDHTYSSAKAAAARSASPASDCVSSSSADEPEEFAAKGGPEGSEGSCPSRESHSEPEEDGRPRGPREAPGDGGPAPAHKKRPPAAKARKVPSDTLPLKKRRTEKPPESDDEEMKEAAGSLLHLAGIRSCLNNITNRTAKGQKEQKETAKN